MLPPLLFGEEKRISRLIDFSRSYFGDGSWIYDKDRFTLYSYRGIAVLNNEVSYFEKKYRGCVGNKTEVHRM